MEETNPLKIHPSTKENEEEWRNLSQNLIQALPKETNWHGKLLCLYDGFWYPQHSIKGLLYLQKYFKPHKTDIILASSPRSGIHWLKALTFTIVNRLRYSLKDTPLLTTDVQQLALVFEFFSFQNDRIPDPDMYNQPRIIATHTSYGSLPCSIKDGENKIIYIYRNPLDMFISMWHFVHTVSSPEAKIMPLDEAFDRLCQGYHGYGPFWDHILEYWRASIERPDKVLFLKYEDMKKDNVPQIKKLASFLGFPFSEEEEKQGLIGEISDFCGFERMKNLEVNKNGKNPAGFPNTAFFRRGEVGDFKNYLSPDMVDKMEKLIQEKFGQCGLSFDFT